ncbi:SUMF1/EgtB/PvdO family nonheme iron enzyme [Sphingomonas sp. S2-65]|uniref:SUMF1/EgtB/PvdO family nonheme iron enzyme n=1 Tax=Sphingomonas sp. S2-65 TaxID=2903960 RepID=UPI001F3365F1|nr:SUMF1/EgtB/PvdO family nonheme iron enzyme [Sphingomonas sp. S2-65]UYY59421.1 formylglycine-generating enzyme family protein [Sphingomonas sp. S2-65]
MAVSIWASLADTVDNPKAAQRDAAPLAIEMVEIRDEGIPPFRLAKFETTWAQYMASVREGACPMPQNGLHRPIVASDASLADDYPVTGITTPAMDCYIAWLNRRSGKRYRLPTPAEWRAAAAHAPAAPRRLDSVARSRGASETASDPREAVRGGIVWRVGQGDPTPDGVFDLESNADEFTSARRPGKASDYACRELGPAFCAEAMIFANPGAEDPNGPRREIWGFQGYPYIFSGFRLAADL